MEVPHRCVFSKYTTETAGLSFPTYVIQVAHQDAVSTKWKVVAQGTGLIFHY